MTYWVVLKTKNCDPKPKVNHNVQNFRLSEKGLDPIAANIHLLPDTTRKSASTATS
jgi:hypothetical protein